MIMEFHRGDHAGPAFDFLLDQANDGHAPLPEWGIAPGVTGQRFIRLAGFPEVRAQSYELAARQLMRLQAEGMLSERLEATR